MSHTVRLTAEPGFAAVHAGTPAGAAHRARITSIDALRGLVMLIMAIDHVRETLYLHLQVADPMDVAATPPQVFFSRLAAHFCAPIFVFLTGLGAWLYANPPGGTPEPCRLGRPPGAPGYPMMQGARHADHHSGQRLARKRHRGQGRRTFWFDQGPS